MRSSAHRQRQLMFFAIFAVVTCCAQIAIAQTPYYIRPCRKSDPSVNECLAKSANHLIEHFRRGIPELGVTDVEPIVIDEIGIALGNGPDGYRATFRNIQAYGVSNLTVTGFRSDLDTYQFQMSIYIPHIAARAQYRSSGVLILLKASGGGDYWGEYDGVRAKIYIKAKPNKVGAHTFLSLQQIKMDFSVKDLKMGVENAHNGNSVLHAALNMFINTNAQELLKEMKPDLKKKLLLLMGNFVENLFANVPYDTWILD